MTCLAPVRPTKIAPVGGGGVVITDRRCFGTSPYATPGTACALSTKMASESVLHRFPLFADPIWPEKRAPGALRLSFLCATFLRRGAHAQHRELKLSV